MRLAAGEAGVWAYDAAYAVVKDPEGFRKEAEAARRLGYLGKSCIHPSQVALANEVFRPADAEIAWALRVTEAAQEAKGKGDRGLPGRRPDDRRPLHPTRRNDAGRRPTARPSASRSREPLMTLKSRDYTPEAKGTLAGIRVLDLSRLVRRQRADPDPRRLRRRGDQGRAAGRRHAARLAHERRADALEDLRAQQEEPRASSCASPRRASCCCELVPSARPLRRELPARHAGEDGARRRRRCWSSTRGWSSCASRAGARTGPYRRRPGFGTLIEGMSGFAAINGFADREPVLPPMYLADGIAGLYGASGAMIALREVELNGGRGQVIDLPLLDPLFAMLGPQAANYRLTGQGEAAHRQPLDQLGAAQRLPVQGRQVRRRCRARRRRWPSALFRAIGRARPRRRSALPHQRRPREARRGARRDHRRVHRASAPRRRTWPSSSRPRSRSGRSTTSRRSSRIRT